MGEVGEFFLSPQPPVPLFAVGDMVLVFEGTGVGKEGLRNVGWFGKVVGREGDAFLVRNRLLAAKGRANLVQGEFMKLQVDFGMESGSGERVHFRNLSKRTRDRIMNSADERNNWVVKSAKKELVRAKQQKTQQKDAYLLRREQMSMQGSSSMQQKTQDYQQQLKYWQDKSETSQKKMKKSQDNNSNESYTDSVRNPNDDKNKRNKNRRNNSSSDE
jgi:hypothetical protein